MKIVTGLSARAWLIRLDSAVDGKGVTIAESTHIHVGWNAAEKIVGVVLLDDDDEDAKVPAAMIVIPVSELDQLLLQLTIAALELGWLPCSPDHEDSETHHEDSETHST